MNDRPKKPHPTKEDATPKEIWQAFLEENQLHYASNEERRKWYVQKTISPEFNTHLKNTSNPDYHASVVQKKWKELRKLDIFREVNPAGNHSGEFVQYININVKNPSVKKSLNKEKIEKLLAALNTGDWDNDIFADKTIAQVAMSLFAAGKISVHQISTILERRQIAKDLPIEKTFKILGDDRKFTKEAKRLLIPAMKDTLYLKVLTHHQLEKFRLFILELPPSERIFYVSPSRKKNHDTHHHSSLLRTLINLDAILFHRSHRKLIHLSSAARDAMGLARYGLTEYIRPIGRLGQQSMDDIEAGVGKQVRHQAMAYPGTKAYGNIHDFQNVTPVEATGHDVYHSQVMSTIPKFFLSALQHLTKLTRQNIPPYKTSKEIWDWIDGDYPYFFFNNKFISPHQDNEKEMTDLFFQMLDYAGGRTDKVGHGGYLLRKLPPGINKNADSHVTPMGVFAFLDMVEHPDEWKKFKINPEHFKTLADQRWYQSYLTAKEVSPYLKNDDSPTKVLKFKLYDFLKARKNTALFPQLNQWIDENKNYFLGHLTFDKVNKKSNMAAWIEHDKGWANTLHLTFEHNYLTCEDALTSMLLGHYKKNHPHADKTSIEFYKQGLHTFNYHSQKAEHYMALRKAGKEHHAAQFSVEPTLGNWIGLNPKLTLLTCSTIIGIPFLLGYIHHQIQKESRPLHSFGRGSAFFKPSNASPSKETIVDSKIERRNKSG